jgi:hypothetical protein
VINMGAAPAPHDGEAALVYDSDAAVLIFFKTKNK